MKLIIVLMMTLLAQSVFAESDCDIRVGKAMGIKVIEFTSGHIVHSKMPVKEVSAQALEEEMINLQDMSICTEKILAKKCVLKLEKVKKETILTLIRGSDRWFSWALKGKQKAENFVRQMKNIGFCS